MEEMRTHRPTPGAYAATKLQTHCRTYRDRKNDRPNCPALLLARDVPERRPLRKQLRAVLATQSASTVPREIRPPTPGKIVRASHRRSEAIASLHQRASLAAESTGSLFQMGRNDSAVTGNGRRRSRILQDQIIYRHGCLDVVITDNGKQFRSKPFRGLLEAA